MPRASLAAFALTLGCSAPSAMDPAAPGRSIEPVPLRDLDPDPDVVEVSLIAGPATFAYLSGRPAQVWAYRDGSVEGALPGVPGPLIQAKRGDQVIVHFKNELEEDGTTIHFHGLRLPEAMDGAHGAVLPGKSFEYSFIAQDAGMFWYHPHVRADAQIERGLYGPMRVSEGPEGRSPGERILVLDDVKLAESGDLAGEWTQDDIAMGRQGNVLLVNGVPLPTIEAIAGSRERWHLVNAANGRFYTLHLPGHPFEVIGWDGGLLEQPYSVDTLRIAPGERYDVLVTLDAAPGERLELRSLPSAHGEGMTATAPDSILYLALGGGAPLDAAPAHPGTIEALPVSAETAVRSFSLTEDLEGKYGPQFFINGEFWPFNKPIHATLGDLEIWEVKNEAKGDHPFHLHGMFFQVLSRNGAKEEQLGWKDTVVVPGGSSLRFAVRYDTPGMWMYHCQIPEHAERGMMGEVMVEAP